MIKGLDAQVMTQRTLDYSKDVSVLMRRDELNNEFADRMNKATARQEAQSVTQAEMADDQNRIKERQEREKGGGRERGKKQRQRPREYLPLYNEDGLPSVGMATEEKILDIEI